MSYLQQFFDKHNITCDYEKCLVGIYFEHVLVEYTSQFNCIGAAKLVGALYKNIDLSIGLQLRGMIDDWEYGPEFRPEWCQHLGFSGYDDMYNNVYNYLHEHAIPEFVEEIADILLEFPSKTEELEKFKAEYGTEGAYKKLWEFMITYDEYEADEEDENNPLSIFLNRRK